MTGENFKKNLSALRRELLATARQYFPDNDNHERYLRVMNIIDTLPDMQQTLIRLRLVEGMDYKDISKLTGIKEATIRQIISRARLAIRKQYIKKDK